MSDPVISSWVMSLSLEQLREEYMGLAVRYAERGATMQDAGDTVRSLYAGSEVSKRMLSLQEQLARVSAERDELRARVAEYDDLRAIIDDLCQTNDYEFPYRVPELIERAIKQRKDIK